jgi:Carboxypeptidase regulatory-like domain
VKGKFIGFVVATSFAVAALSFSAFGQVTSSLSGVVVDSSGAVIPGADVAAKNNATLAEFKTTTVENGTFAIPVLDQGTYTVTVSLPGFKQAILPDVKLNAGAPATVRVTLEVGAPTETVTVEAGAEILQSQTANITTTIAVSQISTLPLVSRNPLDFLVLMPGVNAPGINRNATINGLPQSTIDITLDGINIQDNYNKTTDGFFTRIPTSLDSVQEVTISTAAPEAQGGAMGSAQIKFVTRQGTNEFHGSIYEYHRNPWLNSNYWFNNRDLPPDPATGKAPRARVLFNQYGFRLGGPIILPGFTGRNKAFFFVNYEELRQPSQVNRTRTILNPLAQAGVFRYANGTQSVNLFDLAARNGQTATPDPVTAKLLADIRTATSTTGGIKDLTDPNLQQYSYSPTGSSSQKKPTVRFDVTASAKHQITTTWSYLNGRGGPDFLNNREPLFPGFPNQGQQPADRYTGAFAVRSTLTSNLVNEARTGLSGGPSRFNPLASVKDFLGPVAYQAGFDLGGRVLNTGSTGVALAAGITGAAAVTQPLRRNPLYREINDTLTWIHGAHSLTFGVQYIWTTLTLNQQTLVPSINFGVDTNDPANSMFNAANFPGASSSDIANAKGIYSVLTGRVIAINGDARLDEKTGKYVYLGNGVERSRQKEIGFFAQDSWRVRPGLTLNYGLRWETQGSFFPLNSNYTSVNINDIWGVSGPGNLFAPGTITGRVTPFYQFNKGNNSYDTARGNLAPSFGFAWSPTVQNKLLKQILGESGETVFRAGFAIAYNRRGIGEFRSIISSNPGVSFNTNRDIATGNLGALPLLLRDSARLTPPSFSETPVYPVASPITGAGYAFQPNLKVPYTESWTFGIQREITKNLAVEVRYVGNRFLQNWQANNLNLDENNIVENGLLNEFKLAQANLQANIAAGRGNTFAYTGIPGTSPLPITLAYFSGLPVSQANDPTRYTSTNFASSTFVNTLSLNNPNVCNPPSAINATATTTTTPTTVLPCAPSSYSAALDNSATFRDNAAKASLPKNFMLTNPDLRGGAFIIGNGGWTRYDAMQIEVRRRMSTGLLVQAGYDFAKAFNATRVTFRSSRVNTLDTNTLRHALRVNWVYELPFGKDKKFFSNAGGLANRLAGGWEFQGTGRVQSGQLFNLGNFNLVGMTMRQLNDVYKLRDDAANKIMYILPQDIIDNTIKAFSTSATSSTGYGTLGPPSGRYIAPASNANCIQVYSGQCAPQSIFLTGPRLTRFDLSIIKKIQISERVNFELRGELINAFNNINFMNPTGTAFTSPTSLTFGQVTTAYSDSSNTNDPGGRLGQIVVRINF